MIPLKINPQFKNLIPPLSEDEFRQLEETITSEGCRDAIKTWKGIIIDGHNRYAICQAHGIPYEVSKVRFSSKKDAEIWIINNQLGRRNLSDAARIKLALQKAELLRKKAKQNRSKAGGESINVRKTVAREASVSEGTVYKYMRIQEINNPKLIQQVDKGELKIGAAYAQAYYSPCEELPASAAGLAVTTRTVEVLYNNESTADISNLFSLRGVLNSIERIGRLYRLISDKSSIICGSDDIARVQKRLDAQMGAVQGLVEFDALPVIADNTTILM